MESMKGKSILTSHLKITDEHYSSYSFYDDCEFCGEKADVIRFDNEGDGHTVCMECAIKHNLADSSQEIVEVIQDTMEDSITEHANDKSCDRRFRCSNCHKPITKEVHISVNYDNDIEDTLDEVDFDGDGHLVKVFGDDNAMSYEVLCDKCFNNKYIERY